MCAVGCSGPLKSPEIDSRLRRLGTADCRLGVILPQSVVENLRAYLIHFALWNSIGFCLVN